MSTNYNSKIVTNGLIFCADLSNVKSYPGSGTSIADLSQNAYTGNLVGTPTISNGVITLNGSSQYMNTSYTATSVSACSFDIWFKTTVNGPIIQNRGAAGSGGKSITMGIGPLGGVGSNGLIWIGLNSDNLIIQIGTGAFNSFYDGKWYHTVGTFSQAPGTSITTGSFNLFVNGKQTFTAWSGLTQLGSSTSPISGLGTTKIGYDQAGNKYFNGSLGPVKIYNRVLTAAEVNQNFNAHRGRFGI